MDVEILSCLSAHAGEAVIEVHSWQPPMMNGQPPMWHALDNVEWAATMVLGEWFVLLRRQLRMCERWGGSLPSK